MFTNYFYADTRIGDVDLHFHISGDVFREFYIGGDIEENLEGKSLLNFRFKPYEKLLSEQILSIKDLEKTILLNDLKKLAYIVGNNPRESAFLLRESNEGKLGVISCHGEVKEGKWLLKYDCFDGPSPVEEVIEIMNSGANVNRLIIDSCNEGHKLKSRTPVLYPNRDISIGEILDGTISMRATYSRNLEKISSDEVLNLTIPFVEKLFERVICLTSENWRDKSNCLREYKEAIKRYNQRVIDRIIQRTNK